MTVENTQNKMPPLQMGTTNEYPFNFAVLLQDPTAEEALEAIKASVLQADGTEVELVYNTDYTVTLNTDRIGGTLTVNDIRTSEDYITIYRQYAQTQEVDYKDFNSAPAETFEQCFDKLTMLSQQQQEEINRSLKLNVSSTIIDPSLPEPIANNILIWDSVGSSLKNYDIIGENNQFKAEVNAAIIAGQANIQAQLDEFENVINSEIEDVREAAEKINELEQAVDDAQTAANSAEASASDASQAAISASQAAQNVQTTLNTRANIDLSNLSSVGENKFNTILNNKITNCLLEVPQNIKLELNDGVLTLKAGSKVIVPNGIGVFDEVVTTQDQSITYSWSPSTTRKIMLFTDKTGSFIANYCRDIGTCISGSSVGELTNYTWYDSTNNIVQTHIGVQQSFPIAIITQGSDGVTKSIDQVFNGFGYIGSHFWVDKGVKALAPNGRNEDGSLNNVEITTTKVSTYTRNLNNNVPLWLDVNGLSLTAGNAYDEIRNVVYVVGNEQTTMVRCQVAMTNLTGGKINSFQPKIPFRAVDYNDFNKSIYITETYVNGKSWYRVYSDGWCEQGGVFDYGSLTKDNPGRIVNLLKKFTNANYTITGNVIRDDIPANTNNGLCALPVGFYAPTENSFYLRWYTYQTNEISRYATWTACGYIS